jgi:hypothetical protein
VPLLVKYVDDGTGYILNYELERMIASGKIEAFQREDGGWVDPKVGPMRGQGSLNTYTGPNRRARWL